MKVAFVNQPWNPVVPPLQSPDSIAILTHKLALGLKPSAEVAVYGRSKFKVQNHRVDHLDYRLMPVIGDYLLLKAMAPWHRFRNAARPFFSSPLYYRGYIRQIARDLRRRHSDIVHIHTFSHFVHKIRTVCPEVKLVLHMHDNSLAFRAADLIESQLEGVDLVLGCSNFITNNIRIRYPELAERCETLFNGVDAYYFQGAAESAPPADNRPMRLLFVGRISPEKGVHVLIDAFKHVLRKYPRIQLDIIGPRWVAFKPFIDPLDKDLCLKKLNGFFEKPASYFQFLKDKLSPADDGKVNFIGAIPHHALLYYYRRSDILINPSLCEAFGMSLVEAMACRCPVIATRVGGMIDIISEGQNGVLVERDDPKALAEAILELLCNPERRQAMGIYGRQKILELFTWQRIADSLFEKYRRLLERQ